MYAMWCWCRRRAFCSLRDSSVVSDSGGRWPRMRSWSASTTWPMAFNISRPSRRSLLSLSWSLGGDQSQPISWSETGNWFEVIEIDWKFTWSSETRGPRPTWPIAARRWKYLADAPIDGCRIQFPLDSTWTRWAEKSENWIKLNENAIILGVLKQLIFTQDGLDGRRDAGRRWRRHVVLVILAHVRPHVTVGSVGFDAADEQRNQSDGRRYGRRRRHCNCPLGRRAAISAPLSRNISALSWPDL